MSESITLDTPEQITAWVLISRRHQIALQMNGLKTPGLVKWCRENVPGAEQARTVRDCIVPVEYALSELGAEVSDNLVNVHIMERVNSGAFIDRGVYSDPEEAVNTHPVFMEMQAKGNLEVVLTLDEPRPQNGKIFVPA
jgi:hypothetical protein